jgi:hypothetical protein
MTFVQRLAGALALAGLMSGSPAWAASSAVASASDSLSTSVDSVSRSIKKSSNSSSGTPLAQGDYKVIQVAEVSPELREVTLQAVDGTGAHGSFTLRLPLHTVEQGGLVVGQVVSAHNRPYGVEFARADTRATFFLALDDDWYRELKTVPVKL